MRKSFRMCAKVKKKERVKKDTAVYKKYIVFGVILSRLEICGDIPRI